MSAIWIQILTVNRFTDLPEAKTVTARHWPGCNCIKKKELFCGRLFAGDPAKGEDVCDGIAAETVSGMNAAGNLAGCPEPFDRCAVCTEDTGIRIDAQSAHCVMQGGFARADADAHIRICFNRGQINGTGKNFFSEIFVFLVQNEGIVTLNGLAEFLFRECGLAACRAGCGCCGQLPP